MKLDVIAHIETPFKDRFGTPRQPGLVSSAIGKITFEPAFADPSMLSGMEDFSHLWLTFLFDRIADQGWRKMVRPPRLGGNAKVGVFATRSPYRPNHLGLSVVEIDRIDLTSPDAPAIFVRGVDLTDQTPLVDVRPYIPYTDSLPEARSGFASSGAPRRLLVTVTTSLQQAWSTISEANQLLIEETLALDPAPAYHSDPERLYHLELGTVRVSWTRSDTCIIIQGLEDIPR